jgi:hypothetical protein
VDSCSPSSVSPIVHRADRPAGDAPTPTPCDGCSAATILGASPRPLPYPHMDSSTPARPSSVLLWQQRQHALEAKPTATSIRDQEPAPCACLWPSPRRPLHFAHLRRGGASRCVPLQIELLLRGVLLPVAAPHPAMENFYSCALLQSAVAPPVPTVVRRSTA